MAKKKPDLAVYSGQINELLFDDKNFNRHTQKGLELIDQSIERNGFGRSVLVDKNNRLIAGNGITERALAQGKTKTIVVETDGTEMVVVKRKDLDLDSVEGREMAAADNVTSAVDLDWDEDMLKAVHDDMPELDFDSWGLDLSYLDDESESNATPSPDTSQGNAPNVSPASAEVIEDTVEYETVPSVTERGDVWQIGRHRIICADPSDADTYSALTQGARVGMVYVDSTPLGTLQKDFWSDTLNNINNIIESGVAEYIWFDQKSMIDMVSVLADSATHVEQTLVWRKSAALEDRCDFKLMHETCIYGWRSGNRGHRWFGGGSPSSVLDFEQIHIEGSTIDQKSVALVAHLMRCSSEQGDIVLDPFAFTGTTVIAAEQTGRCAYVCDVNALRCDFIINRYIKFKGSSEGVFLLRGGEAVPYAEIFEERCGEDV